jgi:hypothetical protein
MARLEGKGRYNGRPGYRFLVEAADAGQDAAAPRDTLHVKIWHMNADGKEVVDYDNGAATGIKASFAGNAQRRTALVEGELRLHD